jgi:hypothetical protein
MKVAAGIESTERLYVRHSWNTRTIVFLQSIYHLRYIRPRSIHGAILESATIISIVRHIRRNGSPRNLPGRAGLGPISQTPCLRLAVFGVRWPGEVAEPTEYTSVIGKGVWSSITIEMVVDRLICTHFHTPVTGSALKGGRRWDRRILVHFLIYDVQ